MTHRPIEGVRRPPVNVMGDPLPLRKEAWMSAVIENERVTEADIDVFAYLRQTREEAGYSIEEIATRMDVREAFLRMLEDGELSRKLGPGYIRSLVVRYGACLGLDSEDLLEAVSRLLDGAHPRELREGRSRRTDAHSVLRRRPSPPLVESAPLVRTPSSGTGNGVGRAAEKSATPERSVYESRSRGARPAKGRGVLHTLMAAALLVGMLGVIATGGLLLGRYLTGEVEATGAGTAATTSAQADQASGGDAGAEAGTAAPPLA